MRAALVLATLLAVLGCQSSAPPAVVTANPVAAYQLEREQLAINSIEHSALPRAQRQQMLARWQQRWQHFISTSLATIQK